MRFRIPQYCGTTTMRVRIRPDVHRGGTSPGDACGGMGLPVGEDRVARRDPPIAVEQALLRREPPTTTNQQRNNPDRRLPTTDCWPSVVVADVLIGIRNAHVTCATTLCADSTRCKTFNPRYRATSDPTTGQPATSTDHRPPTIDFLPRILTPRAGDPVAVPARITRAETQAHWAVLVAVPV